MRATSVVVSTQHGEDLEQDEVREIVRPHVVNVLPDGWMCDEAEFYVNPTGRFVIGGPDGDAGLTGRKIIVDTYGGAAPHGGGAFSGKDPDKGRSVRGLCRALPGQERCRCGPCDALHDSAVLCHRRLQASVGLRELSRHGRGRRAAVCAEVLQDLMDLSPRGIREHLGLSRPIYARSAAYGHFRPRSRSRRRFFLGAYGPRR